MNGGGFMFYRECWYVAAWPKEVVSVPLRRIIMNEPVVMFRCADGSLAALEDRCSHRNFPLSKGVVNGDSLQCGYHGLTFDRKGICIYAPGQERPALGSKIHIKAYPIEERHGVAWIWMGESGNADRSLIPDLSWLRAPGWTPFTGGYIHLKAPDQYLVENLLDVSHLAYVHKTSLGSDPDQTAGGKITVTVEPFGVRRVTTSEGVPTPPVYGRSALVGSKIDQRIESTMRPGLYQNLHVLKNSGSGDWSSDGADGDYPIRTRSFHGIVPERDGSTHYFFGGAFMDIDVPAMDGEQARTILTEDVNVLEAIAVNAELIGGRPTVNLRNDVAVMRWRSYRKGILKSIRARP